MAGDTHLGGEDFDDCIVNHCMEEFKNDSGIDISKNSRALRRLRQYCEKAKRILSAAPEAEIEADALDQGEDFSLTLTRAKFEELCKAQFEKCIPCVQGALDDAELQKEDIAEVIMVGGSTRIPRIQQMIKDFMGCDNLNKTVHADEAVAVGATIQSAILDAESVTEGQYDKVKAIKMTDVTPQSLGIEVVGGIMSNVLARNT